MMISALDRQRDARYAVTGDEPMPGDLMLTQPVAEKKFNPAELRDERGEWTRDPAEAAEELTGRKPSARWKGQRDPVQTPMTFVNPVTGQHMGKSEIGDTFERLFATHAGKMMAQRYGGEYQPVSTTGSFSSRTTPLDFRVGRYGGELKTLNINARNQKTAIKAEEIARKRAAIAAENLDPLLVVQVVDMNQRRVMVWSYHDFASKAVSKMEPVGEYEFSPEDFIAAQRSTGHGK